MGKVIKLEVKLKQKEDIKSRIEIAKQADFLLDDGCLLYACPKFCACMEQELKQGECPVKIK